MTSQNTPSPASKREKLKGGMDWLLKISAVGVVLSGIGAFGFGLFLPKIQERLGVTAIHEGFDAFKRDDFEPFRRTVVEALERLTPKPRVATYDAAESYQIGKCYIGSRCVVRFRLRRTLYGAKCAAPSTAPWVRNHGGIKHAAEALSPSLRVDKEWTILLSRFIGPREAQPGRGIYGVDLTYQCPDGTIIETTIPIMIELLPPQD